MPSRIEDYALIGNRETVALVARDGSIDWMGMPRFDSPACFAALLGAPEHGRWLIAPVAEVRRVTRRYAGDTLILETTFESDDGSVCLVDFMSRRDGASDLVRIVRGVRGSVALHTELVVRYDDGAVLPWVSRPATGGVHYTAGPNRLVLDTAIRIDGDHRRSVAAFSVSAGEEVAFTLTWSASFRAIPPAFDPGATRRMEESLWARWASSMHPAAHASEPVRRSLITLKALAHRETGGIVAAATTSLPESIGGTRNWDYRYCWLRDATFTLYAFLDAGFVDEAEAWRSWLVRAVAGNPDDIQMMYGVAGERRLAEYEVRSLPGYEGSAPVRIGNAAAAQVQLDVYGEVIGALCLARSAGLSVDDTSWALECALLSHLETIWEQPDNGIWEMRGDGRHFTHSKIMAWFAFDRAIASAVEFGLDAPLARWTAVRDAIHAQVCERGFDAGQNAFVQCYGEPALDASLLMLTLVGFLPAIDPRVQGTVAAIERRLLRDGLVLRYDTGESGDGLPPGEGAFIPCSFWLVDNYVLLGRIDEATALFERLLSYRNDVGLLAEEYDPVACRQLGNFPQAFSHLALINAAHTIATGEGPAERRRAAQSRRLRPDS